MQHQAFVFMRGLAEDVVGRRDHRVPISRNGLSHIMTGVLCANYSTSRRRIESDYLVGLSSSDRYCFTMATSLGSLAYFRYSRS